MLAKGNRSAGRHRGLPRARRVLPGLDRRRGGQLAQDCITKVEVLEYPELGMEAVWRIEVRDFPAFIIVDDKGNDFFAEEPQPVLTIGTPVAGELGRAPWTRCGPARTIRGPPVIDA